MIYIVILPAAHRYCFELTAQQFGQLGTGFINIFLGGFVPAARQRFSARFQAGRGGVIDDGVDIAGAYQAAQWRYFIEVVALRRKPGGFGLDYLGYLFICLGIYLPHPLCPPLLTRRSAGEGEVL